MIDEVREQEIRLQTEQETRMAIAQKMQEDGMGIELIRKYTGIRLEEKKLKQDEYDMVARQVAAEMLMRGVPFTTIQVATRLPYEALMELKQQYAGFFGEEEEEEQPDPFLAGPPAW